MVFDVLIFLRDPAGPFEVRAKDQNGMVFDCPPGATIDEAVRNAAMTLRGPIAFRLQAEDPNQW